MKTLKAVIGSLIMLAVTLLSNPKFLSKSQIQSEVKSLDEAEGSSGNCGTGGV